MYLTTDQVQSLNSIADSLGAQEAALVFTDRESGVTWTVRRNDDRSWTANESNLVRYSNGDKQVVIPLNF